MKELEARQDELRSFLAEAEEPPALLHPEMATYYRQQVAELHAALQEESEAKRLKAAEVLRSLIDRIVLTPEGGELTIDVVGDLAGILTIAVKGKAPVAGAGASQVEMVAGRRSDLKSPPSQVEMVAGGGFDLNLRSARARALAAQVEVVAGARDHLNLLFRAAA